MSARSLLIIIPLLLSSFSCSLFQSPKKDYSDQYVTGKGLDPAMDSQALIKKLERRETMGGGVWKLRVFPYSQPLVEKMIAEEVLVRNLNPGQEKKLADRMREKYSQSKSCIHFEYEVEKADKMGFLKEWKAYLVDNHDNEYALHWNKQSLAKAPAKSKEVKYQGPTVKWTNSGDACTQLPFVFKNSFRIKMVASDAPWPFEPVHVFRYDFDKFVKVDGKVVNKRPKRKIKKYRGW